MGEKIAAPQLRGAQYACGNYGITEFAGQRTSNIYSAVNSNCWHYVLKEMSYGCARLTRGNKSTKIN